MAIHKCRDCRTPVNGTYYCGACKKKRATPTQAPVAGAPVPKQPGPSSTERGLGAEHRAARKAALKAHVDGDPCGYCGGAMYKGEPLDLDHQIPRALGGDLTSARLAHARCNRSAGGQLSGTLRRARAATSREW